MLLMTTLDEHGWIPLKNKPPVRQRYVRAEIGRWSRHLGVTMQLDNRPGDLKDPTPAVMMVVAAESSGADGLPLALALQRACWESAADIGAPEIRRNIADANSYDGEHLLSCEQTHAISERWKQNRARGIECGVFGSPTYLFEGDLYWGQDRLDFLERHVVTGAPV